MTRLNRILFVVIAGAYSCAIINVYSQPITRSRAESSSSYIGNYQWRISLSPKDHWFDTDITVSQGALINISATGLVTWALPGGRNMSSTVGPNGTRAPFAEDNNRFPMPNAGCGSLIMRIGNATHFVGDSLSLNASESGRILLMVNDDVLSDNSGGFSVVIEIPQSHSLSRSHSILYSSRPRDGHQGIWLLDLMTGSASNLSASEWDDGYPRCSPDGRRIAFATNRDGYWEIYLMNMKGNGQRDLSAQVNLTKNRDGNGYMDWSPDSQALVFASTRNGQEKNELYTTRTDGTGLRRLTIHPAEDVHPAWSPDGKRIAFASERDGNRQIYVMNVDGTNVTRLMSNRWYEDYPAWSPDGSEIAFSSDRDSRESDKLDIYLVNSSGSNVRRITSHPSDDRHPAWSPDGSRLAFVSNRDGNRNIFVMNADGTQVESVATRRNDNEHPSWCKEQTDFVVPPPNVISGGILNGEAISLPKPPYPAIAKAAGAEGTVSVQVLIDESGQVKSASAVSGHPLLRAAAVMAARSAKFNPKQMSGRSVKVSGIINYNFERPNLTQSNQSNQAPMEAWPSYYTALRAAVQKRDRTALREMMSPEFRYDCCDNPDDNGNGETRDEAFLTWDRWLKQGWNALDKLLAQGVVPASAEWTSGNGRSKPNLVAPRTANRKNYAGPIADFEWRDGRWYFVSFQSSENDYD